MKVDVGDFAYSWRGRRLDLDVVVRISRARMNLISGKRSNVERETKRFESDRLT